MSRSLKEKKYATFNVGISLAAAVIVVTDKLKQDPHGMTRFQDFAKLCLCLSDVFMYFSIQICIQVVRKIFVSEEAVLVLGVLLCLRIIRIRAFNGWL